MTTPLPKELAMFAANEKQLDDLIEIVRAYGAAEYKRAVTKAVADGWVPSAYATFFETAMLGEKA